MKPIQLLISILVIFTSLACGATAPQSTINELNQEPLPKVRLTADDFHRSELVDGEFTDEVDEKRFKAIGETLSEISPNRRIIYFVGKLRRVPTQAKIQVHWCHDKVSEPMVVSNVHGSETFSFISTFTPPGRKFIPGNYTVNVLVNDKNIGNKVFKIKGTDPFSAGVSISDIKIAKKIRKGTMAPINPSNKFKAATKLFASFKVKNVVTPTELKINWYRGGSLFSESSISADGNGRFSANVESPSGLPQGLYTVSVEHFGNVLKEAKFAIGNASLGPSIDTIELGAQMGKGSMPKRETTKFKKGTAAIYIGLRFLDLERNSEILIEWTMIDGTNESVYHTIATPIPNGGSGTMSADWSPGEIYPGNYKAVVYINNELASEKEFSVQ